jgi:hypothetical protein
LDQYIYIQAPPDGIMDFDFTGKPPAGIAGQIVLPVHAHIVLPKPSWLKGVRVHAKDNSIEAKLLEAPIESYEIAEAA